VQCARRRHGAGVEASGTPAVVDGVFSPRFRGGLLWVREVVKATPADNTSRSELNGASRQFTSVAGSGPVETLFAGAAPGVLELARGDVAMLHSRGDVQVIAQKTRLVCVAQVRFAGLSPRKHGFQASFALHRCWTVPGSSSRSTTRRDGAGTPS
jgi:hypothetical protein